MPDDITNKRLWKQRREWWICSQGEIKSTPRRRASIGLWMAISVLPSELLHSEDKWCLQCQLVLLTTWGINVIQWCPQKINRADKGINVFKNKCIICWLVHISFTQGEVYPGLERKEYSSQVQPTSDSQGKGQCFLPSLMYLVTEELPFPGHFSVFKIPLHSNFIGSAPQVLKTRSGDMSFPLYRWESWD